MKSKNRLILVGGFLGAGKTTLLYEATKLLIKEGKRIGLITNDQTSELVDTALLLQTHVNVAEVSGSCFCCNFNALADSIDRIGNSSHPDVIIAEPVGSCTDLSATIVQPLKKLYKNQLTVSPLTVLADPFKLTDIIKGGTAGLSSNAAYILKKQLEESDIILISKTDLIGADELALLMEKVRLHYRGTEVLSISSKTGDGIGSWLTKVLTSKKSGHKIIEVDYDTYAKGEAAFGWLNCSVFLSGDQVNWNLTAMNFLQEFSHRIDKLNINVGHIKIILENDTKYLIGNITGTSETITIRGNAGTSNEAMIIVNARVESDPDQLNGIVADIFENVTREKLTMEINTWKYLSPGYPKPTYRYTKVIDDQ